MNPMQINVVVPQGIDTEAKQCLSLAMAYKIDCPEIYELAAEELKNIKTKGATLEAKRKEIVDPLNKAVKSVNDLFRAPAQFLADAERTLKTAMITYDDQQERIRRQQEEDARRAREAAEQKAAQEAEAARKAAEEAEAAAAKATTEEERQQAATALANADQQVEATEAVRTEVVSMPTPIVASSTPRVSGIARKSTWRGECSDFMALVKAVAAGEAPITLLELNQSALNQMARALKTTMSYPGCKAVEDKGLAASRG